MSLLRCYTTKHRLTSASLGRKQKSYLNAACALQAAPQLCLHMKAHTAIAFICMLSVQ